MAKKTTVPTLAVQNELPFGQELIEVSAFEIHDGQHELCVNARELHDKLQIRSQFSTWIRAKVREYGLVEGRDYALHLDHTKPMVKQHGGHRKAVVEYVITVDAAKDIAVGSKTAAGRAIRRSLLDRVENLKNLVPAPAKQRDMVGAVLGAFKKNGARWMGPLGAELNAASRKRDQELYHRMNQVLDAVSRALRLTVVGSVPMQQLSVVRELMLDIQQIYELGAASAPEKIPRRALLTSAVKRSLDSFCKRYLHPMQQTTLRGENVDLYHRDGVEAWLKHAGKAMIRAHIERFAPPEESQA